MKQASKDRVYAFIKQEVNKKGWHNIYLVVVTNEFGREECRGALNELYKEGKINKTEGINGPLIELL